jgi:hypothetical protein
MTDDERLMYGGRVELAPVPLGLFSCGPEATAVHEQCNVHCFSKSLSAGAFQVESPVDKGTFGHLVGFSEAIRSVRQPSAVSKFRGASSGCPLLPRERRRAQRAPTALMTRRDISGLDSGGFHVRPGSVATSRSRPGHLHVEDMAICNCLWP